MTLTSVAAVWRGADLLTFEDVDLPEPAYGEVLVRVRLATVCGSDLHTVSGHRPAPCPSVLGHEAVGDVIAVGAHAPVAVGERVVWGVTVSCGACSRCRAGRTAKCLSVRKVGHEPFEPAWALSGAYAEHVLLPRGAALAVVPLGVGDRVAAPAGCATATVMAAVEAAGDLVGARVLVSGAGMLGLTAVAAAVDAGAAEVTVTDLDPERLSLSTRFGATATVLAGHPLPVVDIALELSGAPTAVASSLAALDVGGSLVLVGSVSPGPSVAMDPEHIVRQWLTVAGVHNYEPRHLHAALALLDRTSALPWADLVSDPVPLSELGGLLTHADRRRLAGPWFPDRQALSRARSG